ncbi:MAG: hypothetical protein RIE53_08350 [Rhodothermales bacterium]
MWTLFIVTGASVLFLMIVWVVVTAIRIVKPESEVLHDDDRLRFVRLRTRSGARVSVRFSDIRALERERERAHAGTHGEEHAYTWLEGASMGIPVDWYADLEVRRN